MRSAILFFFLLGYSLSSFGQSLSGVIIDDVTKEGLVGSYVEIVTVDIVIANEYGRFSVKLPDNLDQVRVKATYIGYHSIDTVVNLNSLNESLLVLRMKVNSFLPTVNISANINTEEVHSPLNRIAPTIASLKNVPALGGEVDIMKALQLVPGISAGAEGTADLLVRGGTADQNLILIDGAKVYNSNHFFGLISPFQPSLVKAVEVFKGAFPARFGGRLSSVVNVTSTDGNPEKWKGEVTLGILNAQANTSGPISKTGTLSIGARSAYLSLTNLFLKQGGSVQTYAFYDANLKYTLRTDRSHLTLNAFHNFDVSTINDDFAQAPTAGKVSYGNTTVSSRWLYSLENTMDVVTELNANQYRFSTDQSVLDDVGNTLATSGITSEIREASGRAELKGNLNRALKFSLGAEFNLRSIRPRNLKGTITEDETDFPDENSQEFGFYFEPILQLTDQLSLRSGLRYQHYILPFSTKEYGFWEPRLSLNIEVNNKSQLSASFARMSQGVHRITNNFIGIPNNLWVTSRAATPPSQSDIYTLGTMVDLKSSSIKAELFFKSMKGLIDPLPGRSLFQAETVDWLNAVSIDGEAEVYGNEYSWNIGKNRWNMTLNYTLSWNKIRYESINRGQWFFRQFDRRHDLAISGSFKISDNWTLFGSFVYNDGFRVTLPKAVYLDGLFNTPVVFHEGRYEAKSPSHHRLDVNFVKEVKKINGHYRRLSLGVYNLYARRNPSFLLHETDTFFDLDSSLVSPELIAITSSIRQFTLFAFLPHISYTFGF